MPFCETKPNAPLPHALTIDAEDWAALMCMYSGRSIPVSAQFGSSVTSTLDALGKAGVRGTFFVVAQHAAEQPSVVREIVAAGHELGSHAWTHRMVGAFSPDEFREDIWRSVATLEELSGQKVCGHRSPLFSLMPEHVWALEAMAEVGLEYDSSVFTLAWHRAGVMIPDHPFILRLPSGREIVEFPAPARKWGPMTVRFIGGRGARLAPASLFVRHLDEREQAGLPGMLYFHTYEMGSENLARYVPRSIGRKRLVMQAAAWAFRVGGGRLQSLVRRLLKDFRWAPMREVIARLPEEGRLPVFELPTA
jgi:polysaccharide deacetylase family protein (PEP-CTERM system associated)